MLSSEYETTNTESNASISDGSSVETTVSVTNRIRELLTVANVDIVVNEKHETIDEEEFEHYRKQFPRIISLDMNSDSFIARVAFKSKVMEYENHLAERCKRFCVEFVDETGTIYAVIFDESIYEIFNGLVEQKLYLIEKVYVRPANEFSTTEHKYELILRRDTIVTALNYDSPSIPKYHFTFKNIPELRNTNVGCRVDIIAICQLLEEKDYLPLPRRNVHFVDLRNNSIIVTFWDDNACDIDQEIKTGMVVVVRGAKVKDFFSPRNLSFGKNSFKLTYPGLPEAISFLSSLGLSARSVNLENA